MTAKMGIIAEGVTFSTPSIIILPMSRPKPAMSAATTGMPMSAAWMESFRVIVV